LDIATLTNAPRRLTLAGEPFEVRALKAREWGILHQWLKEHAEDPITAVVRQISKTKLAGAPIDHEQQDFLMSAARDEAKRWPPRASSSAWFELLGDTDGGDVEFLLTAVRTGRPEFTRQQAEELGERMTAQESTSLMLAALGLDPSPKAEPKADPPLPVSATTKRRPSPTRTSGARRSTR
jgi:hypothetical protein